MRVPVLERYRRYRNRKAPLKLLLDLVLFNAATVICVAARLDFRASPWPLVYTATVPGVVENISFVLVSILLRTPSVLWFYVSLQDAGRLALAVLLSKVVAVALLAASPDVLWSRGAFAGSVVVAFLLLSGVRAGARWWYDHRPAKERGTSSGAADLAVSRVLIVGAGDAGEQILREFESHPELGLVVGFIDDDPSKRGCTLRGVRVYGPVAAIADTAAQTQATQAVIAIPSQAAAVTRTVTSRLADTHVKVQTVPGIWELVDGSVRVNDLRSVQLEDLLARPPVATDLTTVQAYVEGKRVLVTGAGGSIGSEIVRQVVRLNPAEVIMLGRGENRIFHIDREVHDRRSSVHAVPVIGDMRDEQRMQWLFDTYRPEIVFHAAAHKHVPLMEQNPEEAILNNVGGTRTLLRLAASHETERFVNISTDKAVDPINFMGASKRVVELLVQVNDGREHLRATSVRFGNVLGSEGSVTEAFREQLQKSRTLSVTDPAMERFFMLIPEAVQLVLQAGALAQGHDIYVLRMGEPIKILDLARSYIKLSGLEVGVDAAIAISGNRGNEKITEHLWSSVERVVPTTHDSILRVECPVIPELAPLRQAIDNLLNATRSHDSQAMREALHAVDPTISIPEVAEDTAPA